MNTPTAARRPADEGRRLEDDYTWSFKMIVLDFNFLNECIGLLLDIEMLDRVRVPPKAARRPADKGRRLENDCTWSFKMSVLDFNFLNECVGL